MAVSDRVTPTGQSGCDAPVLLVLRALGLGDLLTTVPALRGLRRAHPNHSMVVLTPRELEPIAMACGADRVEHTAGLGRLPDITDGADVAVNLHGRGPRSSRRLLERSPAMLLAHRHPDLVATWSGPLWQRDDHETVRWCRLLQHYGIAADPSDLALDPPPGSALVPPGTIVVHPGAGAAGRRWPVERFAAVIRRLLADGHTVALTGSDDERPLCRDVSRRVGGDVVDLSGRTSIEQLCGVVSAADAVLCNDTGVAHLAVAFRTRSLVLFGPSSPAIWGPPAGVRLHRALWSGMSGDPHSSALDPGLDLIGVHDVMDALHELLSEPAQDPASVDHDLGSEASSHVRPG